MKNKIKFEELDVTSLIIVFWDKKKIIFRTIFISIFLGLIYYFSQSNIYQISSKIYPPEKSNFIKYSELNNLLLSEGFGGDFLVNIITVDKMLKNKLNNRDYLYKFIEKSDLKNQLDNKISEENNAKLIQALTSSLSEINANNLNLYWDSDSWGEVSQVKKIIDYLINMLLIETKNSILNEMLKIEKALVKRNNNKIEQINYELRNIEYGENLKIQKKILFLSDQLKIAKELNIDSINPNKPKGDGYYTKGHLAIQVEIDALISSKNNGGFILQTQDYIDNLNELRTFENNIYTQQLNKEILVLKNDNPQNWIRYNFDLARIIPVKRSIAFVLIFASLAGVLLGIIYILVSSTLKSVRNNLN